MEAIAISTRSSNLLLLNLRASRHLWRPSHLLLPRKQPRLPFQSRQCGLQITACKKLNVPCPNDDAHGPDHSEHHHDGHRRQHGHDHSVHHHHGHHHQHGHVHKNLEHGQEDGQLNAAQKALLNLAKASGWASLADLLRENFRLCSSAMVLLLLAALCHYVQPKAAAKSAQNALIALAFPLVAISAALDALVDIAGGKVNIHVLMASAAFASVFMGNALEGGLLLAMFSLAHIAEDYFANRAMGDIKALKESNPEFALVLDTFDATAPLHFSAITYKHVPMHDLEVGSYILVRAGEAVPVDGEVCQGRSMVTVEHLTGEANPIDKQIGDVVPGGARNLDGMLIIKATKTWNESTLSKIMQLTEEAQLNKPKLQRWLDDFGERYSQAVVAVSFAVALLGPFLFKWPLMSSPGARGSIYRALGLMVAASPCALAAAPLAYVTAISACASKGILLKGGHVLDALASCDTIAFDKTGTLTTGELVCKAIEPIHGHSLSNQKSNNGNACCIPSCEQEALAVAAAMEKGTTHPIARAVVDHTEGKELPHVSIEKFESLPGKGLVATLSVVQSGDDVPLNARLGSLEYITSLFRNDVESRQIKEAASTSLYGCDLVRAVLSVNKKVTLFHFEDKLRPGAADVVSTLKKKAGINLMMLTGDHESSAWRVAKVVGIDEVHFGLKPEDKLYKARILSQDAAKGLIMVGDGINDAPALAAATVGIVLAQRASATAVAVADVLLLQDNIGGVPFVIAKARQTTSLVKQSVLLALSCIFVSALPTVMGFLPLWLTVLLHEGGTLLVCVNSVRALHNPSWSWTHDLRRLANDFIALLTNTLKRLTSSNNVQAASS
ncbi:hypothetical protein SUGI_0266000 [Cryptomeria japonica]|uniref:probable cadmium/zinc-transporting ATPase HMA1, chloroplastic n=1 Tax=Cryptomeria japonica TaxID=3369 RepID=UPI002408B173|nr:probable cadmium/zinc-transporting ATPase HMA1, chloroplastic [Cryptomeria japonica]GLJ16033.1 hypothetical protein SUGI_0266000 [Cryptomeria japonica]